MLEEWTGGSTPAVTYTIGEDIISQSVGSTVSYFVYDGHGSTRQLIRPDKSVIDNYSYDGYGVMLGDTTTPNPAQTAATKYLYAGEQYDKSLSHYYLRARYYNPSNGRFNQIDTFAGSSYDPQSFHKYLYCHADPIDGIDPSGKFSMVDLSITIAVIAFIGGLVQPAFQQVRQNSKQDRLEMEQLAGITFLSQGVQRQMQRDLTDIQDPYELSMTMEFYHEFGGQQKAVTLYNHLLEERALYAIDASIQVSSWASMGLGLTTGIVRASPILWCKTHPPKGPEHWKTIVENALNRAAKGEAKTIYTGRYLTTITNGQFNARMAPDIAEVMLNGKIRIIEVVSPKSQTFNELLEKGWRYKQILGDYLEKYEVINIGELAP